MKPMTFGYTVKYQRTTHGLIRRVHMDSGEIIEIVKKNGYWKPIGRQYHYCLTMRDAIMQVIMGS